MSESQNNLEDEAKKAGWIMKKSKYRNKWKRTWLVLEASNLSYGKSEQGPFKPIPLQNTIIEEANIGDNKKHVFRLKPLNTRNEYLFQALNDDEEHKWMEAICFAKVSAHQSNNTQTCILQ